MRLVCYIAKATADILQQDDDCPIVPIEETITNDSAMSHVLDTLSKAQQSSSQSDAILLSQGDQVIIIYNVILAQ